jgi:hypothetical protein
METVREPSAAAPVVASMHQYFRVMPSDVQRGAIRRLALSGLRDDEIAARIGWPIDSVRRAIAEDECVRHLAANTGSQIRTAKWLSRN